MSTWHTLTNAASFSLIQIVYLIIDILPYTYVQLQEINEDSSHSRANVRSWLVKLPKERFDLVVALFALLQRLATVGKHDTHFTSSSPYATTVQSLYHIVPTIFCTYEPMVRMIYRISSHVISLALVLCGDVC